jgi:hypothetical protein
MSDVKISNLPLLGGGVLTGTDEFPLNRDGTTYLASASQIFPFAQVPDWTPQNVEIDTGQTYLDTGKPVYQQTIIYNTSLGNNVSAVFPHNLPTFTVAWLHKAILISNNNGSTTPLPFVAASAAGNIAIYWDPVKITVRPYNDRTGYFPTMITMRYVKP